MERAGSERGTKAQKALKGWGFGSVRFQVSGVRGQETKAQWKNSKCKILA